MAQVSQVTTGTQTTIANLYISILGRNPEPAGFGFWCDNLADNGNTPAAAANIARGFANSPEFIGTYGGRTTEQAMTLMYNNVLNRAPDANGLAFWVAQANALITRGTSVGDAYALTGAAIITTAGTNSSSDTALIVSKQNAAIASGTAAPTTTFTLTTDIDVVPATGVLPPGAIVNGVINGATDSTFQTGDTINGSAGSSSTVNVTVAANNATAALVEINNVTTVNVRALAVQTINATLFTNVANVASNQSSNVVTVSNGSLSSNYNVTNAVRTSDGGIVVALLAGQTTGTADVLKFGVTNSGTAGVTSTAQNAVETTVQSTTGGVESYTLATNGTNFINFRGFVEGTSTTDAKTLTVTGSGTNSITISGLATTSTINASATTGANTFNLGTTLTSNDVISGGSSTSDVLRATINTIATGVTVTGIETLRLNSGDAAGTIAFAANPGFTTLQMDAGTSGAGLRTLVNGGGFSNLNFVGTGVTANNTTSNVFSGVSTTGGWTGSADALAINFSGAANTGSTPYSVNERIVVNGAESVTVNVANAATTATTALTGITNSTLQSIAFVSNGRITAGSLESGASGSNAISLIDFSGVTGSTQSTLTIGFTSADILGAATVINAGAGGLAVDLASAESTTDVLTFTGGAGIDILAGSINGNDPSQFTGLVVANLGAGNDIVNLASASNVQVTGGDGDDTITTGVQNDTISGGAGDDSITGLAGADVIDVGSGTNTVNYTAASQTRAQTSSFSTFATATSVATADRIASFTAGDIIDLSGAYDVASDVTVSLGSALTSTTAAFVLVSGHFDSATNTFIAATRAATTADDFVFQWADGTRVNSVVITDVVSATTVTLTGVAATDAFTMVFAA